MNCRVDRSDPDAAVAPRRYRLDPLLPTPGHHSMSGIRGDILDVWERSWSGKAKTAPRIRVARGCLCPDGGALWGRALPNRDSTPPTSSAPLYRLNHSKSLVGGTGGPRELVRCVGQRARTEEKVKYSKENSATKHVRYGSSFSPDAEKVLEWKDYLSLFYVSDDEAITTWPYACRDEALAYMKKSEALIKRLLNILMKRLNVSKIDETKEALLMGSRRINLNYHPICPNHDLAVAIGRHSDVSTLTILLQDQTGGLFVRTEDQHGWIHVRPIPGALVINIGDALQIMSNGRYKSIEHRVRANGSKTRVSVPIFVNPRPSDVIGPFVEVLANGEKAKYKDVLYSDYAKHFFRKAHDGKMTIEYAKIS
ncbi:hypothetical protein PIB30_064088 [Stylosanthes scabra]|uniref:Fe2OG dioxygenase domain-containing protein n=1 Tax=Stylosanthes scabra TaxID=79078 RepID=A0ABU6WJZ6_9FABA|nr:hypothetical protein [Stylosanthes scabra]